MGRIALRILCLYICFAPLALSAQKSNNYNHEIADFWVDSVFNTLSQTEKVGQLMMVRCFSNENEKYYDEISRQIRDYGIGGICFFQGDPYTQIQLTQRFQNESKVPLLISQDAEWGPSMRLKEHCLTFPKQMTLGAIQNDSMIYYMGAAIAKQLKVLGVNVSFSPVVDINNNPENPVINYRSFGEDKHNVAAKGIMYMKGLQDNNIAAVAKHFPGHGDTDTDSHLALPVINHTYNHVDCIELYPFKQLINNGVHGIMNAHIYFPKLDSTKNITASLSEPIATGILRDSLNFGGLTFTDGLEMNAIFKYAEPGEIEAISLNAGNDIQLLPVDIDKSVKTIIQWIEEGKIPQEKLDKACKRILKEKFILNINTITPLSNEKAIKNALNSDEDKVLIRDLYKNAITVVKNSHCTLPLDLYYDKTMACIVISDKKIPTLEHSFHKYKDIDSHYIPYDANTSKCNEIQSISDNYDAIVVVISTSLTSIRNNFKISQDVYKLIDMLAYHPMSVVCILANPYLASKITNIDNYNAILFGYEAINDVFDIVPQCLFGAYPIKGRLPVSINKQYKAGMGIDIDKSGVLAYPTKEEIRMQYGDFHKIDSLVNFGINIKAYPGCQVFAIHEGNVILNKSYGYLTYKQNEPTTTNTLYDVASLTKIAATTLSVMNLQSRNMFDIDKYLSDYIPYLKRTNKSDLIIRDVMSHSAHLKPFINFSKPFINSDYRNENSSNKNSSTYTIKVAENFYVSRDIPFFIYDSIAKSELLDLKSLPDNQYKYSDLGFVLLKQAIENATNIPFEDFIANEIYKPIGLQRTTFLPLEKFDSKEIAPTERDNKFRKQTLVGYVHDETAALLGGVSGHAGLFSTAKEIGIIMQMVMQKGMYNNCQYIDPRIVDVFTMSQYPEIDNRRGIGFDKQLINGEEGPVCKEVSMSSFGHSGFTGCLTWADPDNQLVYVFLSNRIHPNVNNDKLSKYDIRTEIHSALYDIIEHKKTKIY